LIRNIVEARKNRVLLVQVMILLLETYIRLK